MEHDLIDDTLVSTKAGIVARCTCGWVSRPCFSSLIASNELTEHVIAEARKEIDEEVAATTQGKT